MDSQNNLDADIDWVGTDEERQEVARVCVVGARGFTRDGGASIITVNCPDAHAFDVEVKRLKEDLDQASLTVHAHWGEPVAEREAAAPVAPRRDLNACSPDLMVGDVMTREVKTLQRNDKLALADELMNVGRFRHVVVLDDDGQVTGVVSRRDIFYGALTWSMGIGRSRYEHTLEETPVKSVMTSQLFTVTPTLPLAEAAKLMMDNKVGCLPVLEGPSVVGVLTEGDFLALMSQPG